MIEKQFFLVHHSGDDVLVTFTFSDCDYMDAEKFKNPNKTKDFVAALAVAQQAILDRFYKWRSRE